MFPELLKIGDFTIYTYGVMLATAFLVGIALAYLRARKAGVEPQIIVDVGIIVLVGAIVGAKLFYVLGHLPEYIERPERLVDVLRAGGVFQGGLIVAVVLSLAYLYYKKQRVWLIADIAAPSVAIGQAIGRIGCFCAGCCYGKPAEGVPWGLEFNRSLLAPHGVALHPTQLYESALMVVVFLLLVLLWRFRRFDGQIFWAYVILYSLVRGGVVEWFRGDHGPVFLGLTGQQLIAVFTLIVGTLIYIYLSRRAKAAGEHPH